jgi:hypothetical protein
MRKDAKLFAEFVASRFPQPCIRVDAYKCYKFQLNGLAPGMDGGEQALQSLKADGYLPDVELNLAIVVWNDYLAHHKLNTEKNSLEYRVTQLERDMAALMRLVGNANLNPNQTDS